MLRRVRIPFLVALSSALQCLIFPVAGPLPAWRAALAWFAFVPFLWALLPDGGTRTLRQAGLIGYSSGVLFYLGTCYWVYATMHTYGGLSPAMAALALGLMCLYLALYHAAFAAALHLVGRQGIAYALASAPFLWILVELARARITSFPWNLLGYAQIDNALLTQLAPLTGVYGLSFVLFAVNACIAAAIVLPKKRRTAGIALAAAVLATALQNYGTWIRPPVRPGTQNAVLLQPNLSVGPGESGDVAALASSSASLSLQAATLVSRPLSIVLWPESPSPYQTDRPEFMHTVAALARDLKTPVLAGAVGLEPTPALPRGYRVYNSAVLFTPAQGYAGRYDKIHLVPFGEYVPYATMFQFASGLTQAVGTFDRGTSRTPVFAEGHRYGVFLCYESIFGDEVRRLVQNGAEVLVNLSDDGWYGDSSAPFQHLNMARMRAIENRRWLLRDTNNGVTASINPNGRVVETMPRHRRGAALMHFDYLHGTTFYAMHGDLFACLCAFIAGIALVYAVVLPRDAAVH